MKYQRDFDDLEQMPLGGICRYHGQIVIRWHNHYEFCLGSVIESIDGLQPLIIDHQKNGYSRNWITVSDKLVPLLDTNTFAWYGNGIAPVVNVMIAPNYTEYCREKLSELFGQHTVVTLLNWRKPDSEKNTIYNVANEMGLQVHVSFNSESHEYRVSVRNSNKSSMRSQLFDLFKNLEVGEDVALDLPVDIAYTRAIGYMLAKDLGIKVKIKSVDNEIHIIRIDSEERSTLTDQLQEFLDSIPYEEERPIETGTDAKSLRNRAYHLSNELGIDVKMRINNNILYITKFHRKQTRQALFDEFVDSIKPGEAKPLPASMSDVSGSYIRVLCSNHAEKLTFRKGLVGKPATPATNPEPHIDSTGNFWMNGKNLGQRNDVFITLKLKPFGLTAEDLK